MSSCRDNVLILADRRSHGKVAARVERWATARCASRHLSKSEATAFPDVDEAGVALGSFGGGADDLDVFFEAVVFAGGVGGGGGGEVEEVFVAGGAFGEGGAGPFFDEGGGGLVGGIPCGGIGLILRGGVGLAMLGKGGQD